MLREMGCLSASVQYALDEAGSGALEFLEEPALSHGQELSILGKTWWVQSSSVEKQGEQAVRWSVQLEDEEARLNKTPYLGKPDWSDVLPKGTKTAQVSRLMDALGLEWNEEDALVPVPSLSGGESIGDIKKQILQWVQRNCPPAGNAAVGSLLRYNPNSTAHAKGEVRMNFNTLPVGGLRSGIFVGNREVRVSAPANAAALAAAINADTDFPATATASGTRINLTAKTAGDAGNDIRLGVGEEEGDVTRSGDNLTGGADSYTETYIVPAEPASVTLEPTWYQSEDQGYPIGIGARWYQFWKGQTDTPAYQLCMAINADPEAEVTAEYRSGGDTSRVYLTAKTPGAAGNSITLEKDAPDDYAVSGPTLTGGAEATVASVCLVKKYYWTYLSSFRFLVTIGGVAAEISLSGVSPSTASAAAQVLNAKFAEKSLPLIASDEGSEDYLRISCTNSGTSGNAIQVTKNLNDYGNFGFGEPTSPVYDINVPVNLSGGAAATAATGWVDCCTGYIELDGQRVDEPPSSTLTDWAERISSLIGFTAEETATHDSILIERKQGGENPIVWEGNTFFKNDSSDGTDETTAERTVPAVAATGWIDLGTTGTHPRVQHTGLFINDVEVLGHSLSALDVVNALNASTDYGVTAALTSGSVADSIVYLTARTAGAEGNAVALDYTGDDGVTLSGSTLTGGTLGAVETIGRLFGGVDSKATALRINPRYDLLCPAAGVYGRFNIVYPAGASLAQTGAFAYYVAPLELVGDKNGRNVSSGSLPDSWLPAVRSAAGQVMEVRGRRVPAGWSIDRRGGGAPAASHEFWSKLPGFDLLEKLGTGNVEYSTGLYFFPVPVDKAYPSESEGEDTLPPPANYKAITSGNLYLLVQGSFPGSSKASNNPSGLHFCQGSLRQTVRFTGDMNELPEGVDAEDVTTFFSDSYKGKRSITLVLDGIFIDRRVKRFYTGTNTDVTPDGGGGGEGGGGTTPEEETREEELTRRDYEEALRQYYAAHSLLYSDVSVDVSKVPNGFDPQSILGAQLVSEQGQTAKCPVRRVTLDMLTKRMTIEAGSPELFSFDELLQRRQLIRKGALRSISQATAGTTDNG